MKAKITINDVEKEITITEEQAKVLGFNFSKIWKPESCEPYWFVGDDGEIYKEFWADTMDDIYRWETGNCKQTEAECEFKREKEKVETELENFAKEHNEPIDWGDFRPEKFYINWDYGENEIVFPSNITYKGNDIYYSSKKIAEAAVKAVGEDRVKKYYLEVK